MKFAQFCVLSIFVCTVASLNSGNDALSHARTLLGRRQNKEGEEEQSQIELTTLTTKRRCQLKAYRNSTVCKLEDEDPRIAKKVFDANKPKLTLCIGGPVMSGRRGLYIHERMKSILSLQDQQKVASDLRDERKNRQKRNASNATKRPADQEKKKCIKIYKELCVTAKSLESPSKAIHVATGINVDLYFYSGYSQWFEVGECMHKDPLVFGNMHDSSNIKCEVAMSAHRAYIIIDPAKMDESHKVKGCGTTPVMDQRFQICLDWVYLPSHCKLQLAKKKCDL